MQAIRNKIRSRRGASLTFALLLFLVCAVVGSVVLVAGTAASGRMSQIAEMDQRYYSVNSAARLLIEMMENKSVRVEKTVMTDLSADDSYRYYEKEGDTEKTVEIDTGFSSIALEAAYRIVNEKNIDQETSFTMDPSFGDEALLVEVKETLVPDGSILFKLQNKNSSGENYVIRVRLASQKQEKHELDVTNHKELITTTLSWKLSDIQTVWEKPAADGGVSP